MCIAAAYSSPPPAHRHCPPITAVALLIAAALLIVAALSSLPHTTHRCRLPLIAAAALLIATALSSPLVFVTWFLGHKSILQICLVIDPFGKEHGGTGAPYTFQQFLVFYSSENSARPLYCCHCLCCPFLWYHDGFDWFCSQYTCAADIFLWRDKKVSAGVIDVATIIWVLFELLEYHLLAFVCHFLILGLAIIFLWSNASSFINRSLPSIPEVNIPEDNVLRVASALRVESIGLSPSSVILHQGRMSRDSLA